MDDNEQAVRGELVRIQQEARTTIHRGVALIGLVPVILIGAAVAAFAMGGFGAFLAFLFAGTYALVGGIAGLASIAGGLTDHRRVIVELRAMDNRRKLPPARVIRR